MSLPSEIDDTENPWAQEQGRNNIPIPKPLSAVPFNAPQQSRSQMVSERASSISHSKRISYIKGNVKDLVFGTCIVNFHHLRGPEVEYSIFENNLELDTSQLWPNLPFQALPDGAHAYEETFCYFTLKYLDTTLFAISCARQIKSDELLEKDADVTRSSVQKAIVLLLRQPIFGKIKTKLSIVTNSFFAQKNFNDTKIVEILFNNLQNIYNDDLNYLDEMDFYSDLSIGDILLSFKKNTLVILKALLLEKKVAFYSSNPTKLCQFEVSFISLIPNLINNLLDCSSPELKSYFDNLKTPTSFQTSDRNSVLKFAGLPLQIFGKGGVFQPYLPLQQFDDLKGLDFYLIGTSNALLLNSTNKLGVDVLVNIDASSLEVLNHDLVNALTLTSYDKKWMSQLVTASMSYNLHSETSNNTNFVGSDDYIRLQFEDYLLALLSTVKFTNFLNKFNNGEIPYEQILSYRDYDTNQIKHFGSSFISRWEKTQNYKLFNEKTDDHIFDVFDPKHVSAELAHDLKSSISEKLQIFNKKLDMSTEHKKHKNKSDYSDQLQKENLKLKTENISEDKGKKLQSPGAKLWGWYNKNIKDK